MNFYNRLSYRGYNPNLLRILFNTTIERLNIALSNVSPNSVRTSSIKILRINNNDIERDELGQTLILHLRYTPNDPPTSTIQQLFRDIVLNPPNNSIPVAQICNNNGAECNINRLTIALSRHLNFGNLKSIRKLGDEPASVTTYLNDN